MEAMNKKLPTIKESADFLLKRMKAEAEPKKRLRLQAIYLLATQQARSRLELSTLLALHRQTIKNWLKLYEQGGIEKLLALYQPAGKKSSLSDEALAELQERLSTPEGFASYREIHQFLQTAHGVAIGYAAVHKLVRYTLRAKPQRPRPSHPKKTKRE
jgi:transposase